MQGILYSTGQTVVYKLSCYGWLQRIALENSNKMYKDELPITMHIKIQTKQVYSTNDLSGLYTMMYLQENADPDFIGFMPPTRETSESHYGSVLKWSSSFHDLKLQKCQLDFYSEVNDCILN